MLSRPSGPLLLALVLVAGFAACGEASAPSPFGTVAVGGGAGAAGSLAYTGGSERDGGVFDPSLGSPCEDDAQCDDGIDCTRDSCSEELSRCRHTPDAPACQNGIYCDGEEECDPLRGCVSGEPVSCSDSDTCTVDSCIEDKESCRHEPRDADGDGDPDGNCPDGGDCDDRDPSISSRATEICGNDIDENCDGVVDETTCVLPQHDVCGDFLEISASGSFALALGAAQSNYAASCAGLDWRDVVVAFTAEEPATIDVTATSEGGDLALATFGVCGDASSEMTCARGATTVPRGGTVGRLLLHEADPVTRVAMIWGSGTEQVELEVEYEPYQPAPVHETCSTAVPLPIGEPFVASIVGLEGDLPTACTLSEGDLVYELVTTSPQDLEVFATSRDGLGEPILSLFSGSCQAASQEVTCHRGDPALLFARALAPGTHYVGVSASGPSDVELRAELRPPSVPADHDDCVAPSPIAPGERVSLPFADYADDVALPCLPGGVDAVYSLNLERSSDVLLLERFSSGDEGAVGLLSLDCDPASALTCITSQRSPARGSLRDVAPGEYLVVAESRVGTPGELSVLLRDSAPPLLVGFADTCADALEVPRRGGLFTGNTTGLDDDYSTGCDRGVGEATGAPEQMLRLVLDSRQRVVLDMSGSGYQTVLDVRRGPTCPGEEVANACSAGFVEGRSFLDLTLDPGEYWLQVDGYDGGSGTFVLNVFLVDP